MWHLIADGYPVVKFTFGENLRSLTIFLNLDGKIHAKISVYQANNRTGRVVINFSFSRPGLSHKK